MPLQSFTAEHLSATPLPADTNVNPEWGHHFDKESAVAIPLPHGNRALVFLDKRLRGSHGEIMQIFGTESVAAHVISCENKEWVVKVEPTAEGHFGLIIYTAAGKALMAGTGEVQRTGQWAVKLATLYPGISNKKKVTGQVGIRGGTGQKTEIQGGIKVTF
jgi:hypothetical protein